MEYPIIGLLLLVTLGDVVDKHSDAVGLQYVGHGKEAELSTSNEPLAFALMSVRLALEYNAQTTDARDRTSRETHAHLLRDGCNDLSIGTSAREGGSWVYDCTQFNI